MQANVEDTDLGSVSDRDRINCSRHLTAAPQGDDHYRLGQVASMKSSFGALAVGILGAVVLVYLAHGGEFPELARSVDYSDGAAGRVSGILWMLFATRTTINVPRLMGTIMCIGVATANSILMITFANDYRKDQSPTPTTRRSPPGHPAASGHHDGAGDDYRHAADVAGVGRRRRTKRPARPGRDWRSSLATFYTLFFVPMVYSALRKSIPSGVEPELQDVLIVIRGPAANAQLRCDRSFGLESYNLA